MCIDISIQTDHIAAQTINVEIKFFETRAVNVLDYTAFALVITNTLVNYEPDARRFFDFIKSLSPKAYQFIK